jgi:hypothetical protein
MSSREIIFAMVPDTQVVSITTIYRECDSRKYRCWENDDKSQHWNSVRMGNKEETRMMMMMMMMTTMTTMTQQCHENEDSSKR